MAALRWARATSARASRMDKSSRAGDPIGAPEKPRSGRSCTICFKMVTISYRRGRNLSVSKRATPGGFRFRQVSTDYPKPPFYFKVRSRVDISKAHALLLREESFMHTWKHTNYGFKLQTALLFRTPRRSRP